MVRYVTDTYVACLSHRMRSADDMVTEKIGRTFAADPRQRFQTLLLKMTEASEEMRRRAEAIALKAQVARHKEVIAELKARDEEQKRRTEQLMSIIAELHADKTAETARRVEEARVTEEQEQDKKRKQEQEQEKQQIEERLVREEAMRPYVNLAAVRTAFWNVLHKPPFTTAHESFLDEFRFDTNLPVSTIAQSWKSGEFTTTFPPGDDLAKITLFVDWKPGENPSKPQLLWQMQAPNSLFYPGDHFGAFLTKN